MDYLKKYITRWWFVGLVMLFLSLVWLGLQYGLNLDKFQGLEFNDLFYTLGIKLIELFMFLLIVKIVMGSNAVLDSIDALFESVYFKRDFLKTLSPEALMSIAKNINETNPSVFIEDHTEKINAYNNIEQLWNEGNIDKPYIILESYYTDTLYESGILISHKKYKFKMMRTDRLDVKYEYLPFDKNVKEDLGEEIYNTSQPRNRWEEKSFKCKLKDCSHPINVEMATKIKDGERWLVFNFKTQRPIQENTEFELIFSMSDKIDLTNNANAITRRSNFFRTDFNQPHGIRHITFQLESYNDQSNTAPKLPYTPVLLIDGNEPKKGDAVVKEDENIFYRIWSWEISKKSKDLKNILFELHNIA